MFSREWRCSWSSTDSRCSNYIWVISIFTAYQGATYIRRFDDMFPFQLLWPSTILCDSWISWRHLKWLTKSRKISRHLRQLSNTLTCIIKWLVISPLTSTIFIYSIFHEIYTMFCCIRDMEMSKKHQSLRLALELLIENTQINTQVPMS